MAASPFSRSLRSLNTDAYRPSLVVLGTALILLCLWLFWFFFSQLTIYADTQQFQFRDDGYIRAIFAPEDHARIRHGQSAVIRFEGDIGREIGPVSMVVSDIRSLQGIEFIELYAPESRQLFDELPRDIPGRVRVEVETISPFVMMMRVSGQLIDDNPVVNSPQSNEQFRQR